MEKILEINYPNDVLQDTESLIKTLSIRNCSDSNTPPIRSSCKHQWDELLKKWGSGKTKPSSVAEVLHNEDITRVAVTDSEDLSTPEKLDNWIYLRITNGNIYPQLQFYYPN